MCLVRHLEIVIAKIEALFSPRHPPVRPYYRSTGVSPPGDNTPASPPSSPSISLNPTSPVSSPSVSLNPTSPVHYPHSSEDDGGDTAWSRCYRLIAVCEMLLCVLLLTAITVLWINYHILKIENIQLKTSNNNLTIEKDQLQREKAKNLRKIWNLGKCVSFSSSLYFMSNEKKNWTERIEDCIKRGADLVIINSTEEENFITEQLNRSRAWIDLSDRDTEGEWKWVDGTPLTPGFRKWAYQQPDNDSGKNEKDCGETGFRDEQQWNDRPCSHEQGWICEKRK
ncbi:CD209 antigen-like protein A [Clarias gariepinus]|uniref:CD209 antigen-like protein A n=1 Tax=Clarias gariepinus TaxID=13013 RepID=UPI00234C20C2|nr:CD209 antigen-like protein A [Clarias gariepinus]